MDAFLLDGQSWVVTTETCFGTQGLKCLLFGFFRIKFADYWCVVIAEGFIGVEEELALGRWEKLGKGLKGENSGRESRDSKDIFLRYAWGWSRDSKKYALAQKEDWCWELKGYTFERLTQFRDIWCQANSFEVFLKNFIGNPLKV